jgi:tetratricopeptide (TPR) repeat protein
LPDNPTYLDTHAWVLFKKGDFSLAKFYMKSALDNGGEENPTLLEHYGDILIKMEETNEALKYWQKAIEFGGDSNLLERKINEKKYLSGESTAGSRAIRTTPIFVSISKQ